MFKKKQATIDLFVVIDNYKDTGSKVDISELKFLTITEKKEQCEEYINRRLFLENKEHFKGWCGLRELDYEDSKSWELYVKSTGNISFDKFIISRVTYKIKDVAAIFRMFNGCVPIGTEYEDTIEFLQFMQSLPQEDIDRMEQALKKSIEEDLEEEDKSVDK
jgi:hypothetical protein